MPKPKSPTRSELARRQRELEADRRRLDWLQQKTWDERPMGPGFAIAFWSPIKDGSIRSIIDTAMTPKVPER